ncbi:hypothetical protein AQUCO_00700809v1 [Aquilegia coerulea]|uniref:RING-type domain-containing protein n=1 Tax=Aquilegia coerulea TaxID=218851 RepID=A0A2G5ELU5_AQUCA|nr:hypothetical protein AQUCO_00700809v1 [Aquilegia coerulea]
MEFYAYHFADSSSSSSSKFSSWSFEVWRESFRQLTVKAVLGNFISAILGLFFAVVGMLVGVITGAIIGHEAKCGFLRGSAVGAVSGVLLSIEVFETFRRLWMTDGQRLQCLLYLVDVLVSLVNGRLVRERVGPIMFNTVHSQTNDAIFEEVPDIFESGVCKGLSGETVERIQKIEITSNNLADSWGQRISCTVCLQDFQLGERVRELPYCHHMFHLPCIDQWLIKHGFCPLCRRAL